MLDLSPIPAFDDNYIWALRHGQQAWLVDPGDAEPALAWLHQQGLQLAGLLITHHHGDHIGGIAGLTAHQPDLPIYGPARISAVNHRIADRQLLQLGPWQLTAMAVPAHTLDHHAYYLHPGQDHPGALFCGDTLFAAGCGRLFEGTPDQLASALSRFAALPADTLVCCAHEYTLANLRFALAAEPDNGDLVLRQQRAHCLRQVGLPTLPSTIAEELATNPFMRTNAPTIVASLRAHTEAPLDSPVQRLAALRRWKDRF